MFGISKTNLENVELNLKIETKSRRVENWQRGRSVSRWRIKVFEQTAQWLN